MTTVRVVDRSFDGEAEHFRALHDPDTGLPKVALLRDRLDVALAHATSRDNYVAVFHVAIDRSTTGPRDHGQRARAAAAAIIDAVGPADTVARVGEFEFVVVCFDIAYEEDTAPILERILSGLKHSCAVASEIGVAFGRGADPDDLLASARHAAARA